MRGLTIDSIAQRSLVVLRADSRTASIPRGALTLAAFSFTANERPLAVPSMASMSVSYASGHVPDTRLVLEVLS